MPAGAFYVEHRENATDKLKTLCDDRGVPIYPVKVQVDVPKHRVQKLRIGMYQRYWGGNADEGWSRLVLEKFDFPYMTLMDADFREGNLNSKVDVIILPADRPEMILGPDSGETKKTPYPLPPMPPEYRSGIGKEGACALKDFVNKGGRLVAFDSSSKFAIDTCELKVANLLENLTFKDYYCHGSTLRVKVDGRNQIGYGMPNECYALVWGGQAFEVRDTFASDRYCIVAEYPEKDLLQSGWLIGEEIMAGKACVMTAKCGNGEVVLFGFRPLFRAQTHGTFKLLFNCLLG
jgi:hypothetical protein